MSNETNPFETAPADSNDNNENPSASQSETDNTDANADNPFAGEIDAETNPWGNSEHSESVTPSSFGGLWRAGI